MPGLLLRAWGEGERFGEGVGRESMITGGTRVKEGRKDAGGGSANTLYAEGQPYGLSPTANNPRYSIDYLSSFSPSTPRGRVSQIPRLRCESLRHGSRNRRWATRSVLYDIAVLEVCWDSIT